MDLQKLLIKMLIKQIIKPIEFFISINILNTITINKRFFVLMKAVLEN